MTLQIISKIRIYDPTLPIVLYVVCLALSTTILALMGWMNISGVLTNDTLITMNSMVLGLLVSSAWIIVASLLWYVLRGVYDIWKERKSRMEN